MSNRTTSALQDARRVQINAPAFAHCGQRSAHESCAHQRHQALCGASPKTPLLVSALRGTALLPPRPGVSQSVVSPPGTELSRPRTSSAAAKDASGLAAAPRCGFSKSHGSPPSQRPACGLTLRSAATPRGKPLGRRGALAYAAPRRPSALPRGSRLAQTLGRTQRASANVTPRLSSMPAAFQTRQGPERAPGSSHGAKGESEPRRQPFARTGVLIMHRLSLRFAGSALFFPTARVNQFVGPPPCQHSGCGLLGQWRRKSATALARRCTSQRVKTSAPTLRLSSARPNPSLSTDPLRRASLPVRRLGLSCTARASRPASAVGVSSNVRPHTAGISKRGTSAVQHARRVSSPAAVGARSGELSRCEK